MMFLLMTQRSQPVAFRVLSSTVGEEPERKQWRKWTGMERQVYSFYRSLEGLGRRIH
jgi:hypothetical protein